MVIVRLLFFLLFYINHRLLLQVFVFFGMRLLLTRLYIVTFTVLSGVFVSCVNFCGACKLPCEVFVIGRFRMSWGVLTVGRIRNARVFTSHVAAGSIKYVPGRFCFVTSVFRCSTHGYPSRYYLVVLFSMHIAFLCFLE